MESLRRWPPLAWLGVYVGSVLILMGSRGDWGLLAAGGAVVLVAFAFAVTQAVRSSDDDPRPPATSWWLVGLAVFYGICAAAAGLSLGVAYGLAVLAAGVIPGTAIALVIAAARRKTAAAADGLRDASAEAHDDPLPGIGVDTSDHSRAR
jgi:zinc transporter ZupT